MLKSEIKRRLQTKNTDLLELEGYEQEARRARAVAEQHVLTLEPEITKFDEDIRRQNECIANLHAEIRDWKAKIKGWEK